jgi:hypothetical protein
MCTFAILALRRIRQEDNKFEASVAYVARPGLKNKKQKQADKKSHISQGKVEHRDKK